MACRALLFDFNGTLSDDEPVLCRVFADLFAEYGRPLTEHEYYGLLAGLSDIEIARTWLGDRDDLDAVVRQRVNRYRAAVSDGSTISPERREAVRYAAARVPVAIVSGAAHAEIEPVIRAAGVDGLFAAVVSSDSVDDGKPHPEGYLKALSLLQPRAAGLVAGEVTAFEDTEAGIASAKAAGMRCIAVSGTHPGERLAAADEIVDGIDVALMRRLLG
ncbi:MAG: HAD family hydrolase [Gaiellales bacterium]